MEVLISDLALSSLSKGPDTCALSYIGPSFRTEFSLDSLLWSRSEGRYRRSQHIYKGPFIL